MENVGRNKTNEDPKRKTSKNGTDERKNETQQTNTRKQTTQDEKEPDRKSKKETRQEGIATERETPCTSWVAGNRTRRNGTK